PTGRVAVSGGVFTWEVLPAAYLLRAGVRCEIDYAAAKTLTPGVFAPKTIIAAGSPLRQSPLPTKTVTVRRKRLGPEVCVENRLQPGEATRTGGSGRRSAWRSACRVRI